MRFDQTHRSTKVKKKKKKQRKSEVEIKPRKLRIMEVAKVLHMNGGVGDASYANNSFVQVYLITT